MKKFTTLLFLVALFSLNFANAQQPPATQAPGIKTFALQPDLMGSAPSSVNLFTGDVALPLNLLSLSGRGGLDVNVTINYTSNVQHSVGVWNLDAPTGILGLGWSMDLPKIVVDHKSTGSKEDDSYFLLQGSASNRLIRTTSGSDAGGAFKVYETKNYKFWKIKYYTGLQKWDITDENGIRTIYGDVNSGRGTLQYVVNWDNWIGHSAQLSGQSQMPISWSLSEIINRWNEKVTFEYENTEQSVGSAAGQKHTEATYLKQITDALGRKVKFFYNLKDASYVMEPHTEQNEPDAYQEVYEKKYLDHIDLETETGSKFTSVHFGYGSIDAGNIAKMLLTSIIQKNALGQQLPGLQFLYNPTGSTKGMLNKITYPTGGTVTYTYTSKTVSRANRQLTISQPAAGYAEPKVWVAEDYVVVGWRQLSSGGGHTSSGKNVKLYVYQWLGGWKEKFLVDIPDVSLDDGGDPNMLDWAKFQISVQSNFFSVLHANNGTSNYLVRMYSKSETTRGDWTSYVSTATDFGDIYDQRSLTSFVTGENFVIVGADALSSSSTHSTSRWISTKDGWTRTTIPEIAGARHYYTGTGNYFIRHNTGVSPVPVGSLATPPKFSFTYLTEDRKWVETALSSPVPFTGYGRSYWHAGSSFVVSMADDNVERIYRWNSAYTTFYKDQNDVNSNDLWGSRADEAPVNVVGNSMVAINDDRSYFARFDGKYWYKSSVKSADNFYYFFPSYGEDLVVSAVSDPLGGDFHYNGIRREFDPNLLLWKTDVPMNGVDRGQNSYAGNDFYSFGKNYYYRQPSGSWTKTVTTLTNSELASEVASPQFSVWHAYNPNYTLIDVKKFKNGVLLPSFYPGGSVLMNSRRFKSYGVGFETIVTRPQSADGSLATSITLTRFIKDNLVGTLIDYPVTLITINDGSVNEYTSLDYNAGTAVLDVTGSVAQYNEVTVMPGCNACLVTTPTKPNGYTKNFFYNGLTAAELGVSFMPVDLRWTGLSYKLETYNASSALIASAVTSYSTFTKTLNNNSGELIETGNYVRSTGFSSTQDGITSTSTDNYNQNTGLLEERLNFDYDSKVGNTNRLVTRYKYFWEQYDPTRQLNILTPVIQTKELVNRGGAETVLSVSATTWKTWNNVWAPHKTYQWKRSGSSDFGFAAWSGSGEPAGDWIKLSQIDNIDNTGQVLQVSK